MHQVYNNLSTYSADLFGVCSALYELGGLIVMHDASGCNSTYNTHDEPRWYTIDSMVYVSGLNEQDAILGNDNRLIDDICDVALKEHPKFIALSRSVLPTYMGTDVRGIARVIEKRTGIPSFGFTTNGMDTYVMGAGAAYLAIAERFCRKDLSYELANADLSAAETKENDLFNKTDSPGGASDAESSEKGTAPDRLKVNLLGVTPLDFSVSGNVEALEQTIQDMGFEVWSNWSMGCTLEELSQAPDADVTLVVSTTGLPAAKYLSKTFDVPYVIGLPCGSNATEHIRGLLVEAARTGKNLSLFEDALSDGVRALSENTGVDGVRSLSEDTGADGTRMLSEGKNQKDSEIKTDDARLVKAAVVSEKSVCIVGEAVHSASLRYCLECEKGYHDVTVLCPLEKDAGVLRDSDLHMTDEASITRILNEKDIVIADPVYRRVVGPSIQFVEDPHDAFSGRMYHDRGRKFVGNTCLPEL